MLSWPTGWTLLWTRPTPSGTATGRRSETPELIPACEEHAPGHNARGEKLAFYDALETNDSAVQVLGDETLCEIARELVDTVRGNVTIDWTLRENVPANLRRILRKYGYPLDKQKKATLTVQEQTEVLSEGWAAA